jgi:hypothetical protein
MKDQSRSGTTEKLEGWEEYVLNLFLFLLFVLLQWASQAKLN